MTCIFCGCTDAAACPGGCSWVSPKLPICSSCVELLRYAMSDAAVRDRHRQLVTIRRATARRAAARAKKRRKR